MFLFIDQTRICDHNFFQEGSLWREISSDYCWQSECPKLADCESGIFQTWDLMTAVSSKMIFRRNQLMTAMSLLSSRLATHVRHNMLRWATTMEHRGSRCVLWTHTLYTHTTHTLAPNMTDWSGNLCQHIQATQRCQYLAVSVLEISACFGRACDWGSHQALWLLSEPEGAFNFGHFEFWYKDLCTWWPKSCETTLLVGNGERDVAINLCMQDSPPLGGKAVNGSSCEGVSGHCSLDIRVWARTIQLRQMTWLMQNAILTTSMFEHQ